MSATHLVACRSCARHLRVSELRCPFCGSAMDVDVRARPAPRPPAMRLSRAALFALGTGGAVLPVACGAGAPEVESLSDAGRGESSNASTTSTFNYGVPYGLPPGDSGSTGAHDAGHDAHVVMMGSGGIGAYGNFTMSQPEPDAGGTSSSSGTLDAGLPDAGRSSSSGGTRDAGLPDAHYTGAGGGGAAGGQGGGAAGGSHGGGGGNQGGGGGYQGAGGGASYGGPPPWDFCDDCAAPS